MAIKCIVIMQNQKSKRGGKREGAGRPRGTRNNVVSVRLSDEALAKLNQYQNKSRYIDNLIRGAE